MPLTDRLPAAAIAVTSRNAVMFLLMYFEGLDEERAARRWLVSPR
jgi:uroporphyrinogen-III synthase